MADTTTVPELLPCPFCGSTEAELYEADLSTSHPVQVAASCPPHQWAFAPTVGYYRCMTCAERRDWNHPRYSETEREYRSTRLTPPVAEEGLERHVDAAETAWHAYACPGASKGKPEFMAGYRAALSSPVQPDQGLPAFERLQREERAEQGDDQAAADIIVERASEAFREELKRIIPDRRYSDEFVGNVVRSKGDALFNLISGKPLEPWAEQWLENKAAGAVQPDGAYRSALAVLEDARTYIATDLGCGVVQGEEYARNLLAQIDQALTQSELIPGEGA